MIKRVEGICGLSVVEVNISVNDLYFPGDERQQARVERTARRDGDVTEGGKASVPLLARVELAHLAVSEALSTEGVWRLLKGRAVPG